MCRPGTVFGMLCGVTGWIIYDSYCFCETLTILISLPAQQACRYWVVLEQTTARAIRHARMWSSSAPFSVVLTSF